MNGASLIGNWQYYIGNGIQREVHSFPLGNSFTIYLAMPLGFHHGLSCVCGEVVLGWLCTNSCFHVAMHVCV